MNKQRRKREYVYMPDHPLAMAHGCVEKHRLEAFEAGRKVTKRRIAGGKVVNHGNAVDKATGRVHQSVADLLASRGKRAEIGNPRVSCFCGCGEEFAMFRYYESGSTRPRRFKNGHGKHAKPWCERTDCQAPRGPFDKFCRTCTRKAKEHVRPEREVA